MKKRVLSLLLALMMIVSLVPTAVMAYSSTDVAYAVTGGNIYFNESTGTITDCDTSVTEANIPSEINGVAVTSIGDDAFAWCDSLTSITIPDSVTSIGDYAFYGCSSLTEITIPDSVTSIGVCAFYNCSSLTSVVIPKGVSSIGDYAFYGCSSMESINVAEDNSNYSSIDGVLFNKGQTILKKYPSAKDCVTYTVPESVATIESNAFMDCATLASVTIPDSVTSIGVLAFYNCSSLASIEIPDGITSIEYGTFYGCSSLESVKIPDGVTSIGDSAFRDCSSLESITIPDSVTSIGDYAFMYCSGLASITLPNSVTSIGNGAFFGCGSLTAITIPNSVTSIGDYAFFRCSSLTAVTIPNSVTSIGDYAFDGCNSLESINVAEDNSNYSSVDGVLFDKNLTTLMRCPSGKDCDKYVVPESVTTIESNAFMDCVTLASVTIPDSVTSIGGYTFYGCSSLKNVTLPNGITGIWDDTFYGCSSLESVTIPDSVTSIGDAAFEGCSSLTSIEIPDGVTKIGTEIFWGCVSLESINVAENNSNYSSVDGVLFDKNQTTLMRYPSGKDCDKYVVPESVTSIGFNAFGDCSRLESITIPDNVTRIVGHTFNGCSSLATITIPDSVTIIRWYAFKDCNHLTDVYYTGDETQWKEISIDLEGNFCLENATIHFNYVPHKHSYTSTVTAPTCTAKGYTTYTCSCGDSYVDNETNALGHSYGEWTQTKAPTCTAAGTEIRTCSRCNATESRTVEAPGHVIVHHDAKTATCTEIGWNAYDTCKNCDYTTYSEIPATGHHHNAVVTAPTCTAKGYTTYTCSCGNSYVDNYTDALGHSYTSGKCTRCGAADPDYKSPTAVTFSDVAAKAYYANAVQWAVENKITKGTDDTHFSPDQGCTRGQVVTFLWRAAGSPKVSGNAGFVDVKSSDYYYDAVKWAVANGITTGTDATHFSPNATCTRGQVVTFMYRAEGSPATSGSCGFVDVKSADYYYNAVIWAVANEITNGTDATHFSPSATCTRAQVVTFLYRNAEK